MNLLILVTHLLGIGHLNRAAALGRAFAREGHSVTLISGGRPAPTVDMSGIALVKLPPVHIQGTDFKTLFQPDGRPADAVFFTERTKILEENIHKIRPDAAIVELYPFGRRQMADEFQFALGVLERVAPGCPVFSSVRDVLAPPSTEKKRLGVDERLARHFAAVLVHGDAAVLPLEASWPVGSGLARVLRYTGYVREAGSVLAPEGAPSGEILVSGGGSAAALPLQRAAIGAARSDPARRWRILVGHGVSEPDFAELQACASQNTTVERVRKDFNALLPRAACSVSMAGYNTMLDLAAARLPAVIVPFDAGGEVEQSIRANRFAEMGLVLVVSSAELTAERVLTAVNDAIARGAPAATLAMDGAAEAVRIVNHECAEHRQVEAAWSGVVRALDRAAARGMTVPFWWRDDDAIAPTPALDRLLDLSLRLRAPVALAVIPERATPELAVRLASAPLAEVLIHGITHRNNAVDGAKKQELVGGRPDLLTMLSNGKRRLEDLFGCKTLPVLVPPWNRVAPDVIHDLAALGFRGLSTFADEREEPGLVVVNTHVDPIDWKGGGGLACALAHIRHTGALIDAWVEGRRTRPIGLLSHHLAHDAWVWRFVERWLETVSRHPAARICAARECFGLTDEGARAPKEG